MAPKLSQEVALRVGKGVDRPVTVHVLGAGFSHAAGLPLCKDLFHEMDRFMLREYLSACGQKHGHGVADFFAELVVGWWHQLRDQIRKREPFRGLVTVDELGFIDGNIETLLNVIDNAIEDSQGEKGFDFNSNATLWRFNLVNCLAYYIRWAVPKLLEERVLNMLPVLKYIYIFVRPGDSIISFNYDDIVEQVLLEATQLAPQSGLEWHYGDGYGFNLTEHTLFASSDLIVPLPVSTGSNVRLLNLHGSAKWTWDVLRQRLVFDESLLFDDMYTTPTGMTHGRRPLIAEPRRVKPLHLDVLRQIWDTAERSLTCAQQVVVIGYSLPDADGAAEKLFVSSLAKTNASLIVIDPTQRANHRLVSVFGDRVSYCEQTLQRFMGTVEENL